MGVFLRYMASVAVLVHLLRPNEGFRALNLAEINRPSRPQWQASSSPAQPNASLFGVLRASSRRAYLSLATSPTPTSAPASTTGSRIGTSIASATSVSTTASVSESPRRRAEQQQEEQQRQPQGLGDTVSIKGITFSRWKGEDAELSNPTRDNLKPLLLYLPGIEGLGTSIETQLPALSDKFRVYRLIIGAEDRSTFSKLSAAVTGFVDIAADDGGGRGGEKTVVLGESFGGMLGLRLGQLRPEKVQAVFAVNPATSFSRTAWRSLGPILSLAPKSPYKAASIAVFAATIPDRSQMMSVTDVLFDRKNGLSLPERPKALAGKLGELWEMINDVSENLPPATLRWRIQNWLSVGQGRVERGLGDMKVPVTVIAGSADRLLPSMEEAERLENLIPGCRRMVLEGHGHAPLFDGRVDISEIIKSDPALEGVNFPTVEEDKGNGEGSENESDMASRLSGVYAKDWVNDFVEPDESMMEEGTKTIDFLLKSVSPVFFSTKEDGTCVSGLSAIPDADRSRPIVFVGNHQLLALDLGVIVERLFSEKRILARGLAHPVVFLGQTTPRALDGVVDGVVKQSEESDRKSQAAGNSGGGGGGEGGGKDENGMQTFFTKFGAVPVSPRNMYRLLKRGDNVLLFPGGVSEAYHKKGEEYKLFWPEKGEFVRLAASSGAIIIPFSAVGIADSLEMVLDGDQLLGVPVVGDRLRKQNEGTPSARGGSSKEQFVPPFVLPKLPSRVYVRFGEPVSLEGLDKSNRAACQDKYEHVKDEVELGIDSLLRAREQDPYLDPATRLLYERLRGEPAPTFAAPVLDAAVVRARMSKDGQRRRQSRSSVQTQDADQ